MSETDLLYTVPESAKILKTNPNMVYDLIKHKLITPLKLGRIKISRSELLDFIEKYKGWDLTDLKNIKQIS